MGNSAKQTLGQIEMTEYMLVMKTPQFLYRFRPLKSGKILKREIEALRDSYLFAPAFSEMNDPMEAYYETGGPGDSAVNNMIPGATDFAYNQHGLMIKDCALVSFAKTHENPAMWAYYGSNFKGMSLEFDSAKLAIGNFHGPQFYPVTYAQNSPSLLFHQTLDQKQSLKCVLTKRIEWKHEEEWRYVSTVRGQIHYLDDALRRVFLGPWIDPKHAKAICKVLTKRPVEVMQGEINGYELRFRTIQNGQTLEESEKIGTGHFCPEDLECSRAEFSEFLTVPVQNLVAECQKLSHHPNFEKIEFDGVYGSPETTLRLCCEYKLRNGSKMSHVRHYDENLHFIPGTD